MSVAGGWHKRSAKRKSSPPTGALAVTSVTGESLFPRRKWVVPEPAAITHSELLPRLHPRLASWFRETYGSFTDAQLRCVPAILQNESILLTSPTGSGKTLAGFLGVFDHLLRELEQGPLIAGRALSLRLAAARTDLRHREESACADCRDGTGEGAAHPCADWRHERQRARKVSAETGALSRHHAGESRGHARAGEHLHVILTSCRFVIVDELHSFAGNKRGVDLALSLERLEELVKPNGPAMPRWTFRDRGAARFARAFSRRRRSALPDRGGEDGEGIDRRSFLADPAEAISARGLHRRPALCGAGGADPVAKIGHRLHQCPLGGGTDSGSD